MSAAAGAAAAVVVVVVWLLAGWPSALLTATALLMLWVMRWRPEP